MLMRATSHTVRIPFHCGLRRGDIGKCSWMDPPLPAWVQELVSAADGCQPVDNVMRGGFGRQAHACRANCSELCRSTRRVTDGAVAENQGKARHPGDLRVTLFPSKHSRVRPPGPSGQGIPSPAHTASNRTIRPPIGGRMGCNALSLKSRVLKIESLRSASLQVLA